MLPVFKRFSIADYPTAPEWLGYMFNSLNVFAETTTQTLTKNLTIGTNVQGQKYTTSFTTSSTYATGDFTTITFNYTGGGQPNCCLIGQITNNDGSTILTPVSATNWYLNINTNPYTVTIKYIAGLQNSTTYTVTFLVI